MFNDIRVWALIGFVLIVATNGGSARDGMATAKDVRAERTEVRQAERSMAREARYTKSASKVALDRVQAGCVPVLLNKPTIAADGTTYREEVRLSNGQTVDNGAGTPMDGAFLCTSTGDTAVARDGKVEDIVRANPEDLAEYQSFFSQLSLDGYPAQVNLQY